MQHVAKHDWQSESKSDTKTGEFIAECCRVFAECCRVLQHLRGNIDVALEAAYDPMGHVLTKFVELD